MKRIETTEHTEIRITTRSMDPKPALYVCTVCGISGALSRFAIDDCKVTGQSASSGWRQRTSNPHGHADL